ncbi:MAG TPA: CHASE3 domain-containing protein, partial [Kofleriaceae bacterium]
MNRTALPAPRSRKILPASATAALSAAVVAILVIALLSYRSLAARSEAAGAVNHTNDVEDHLHRFLSDVKDAETGQRGFLLTGAEHYLTSYQLSLGAIPSELATLRRLTADTPLQQKRLDIIDRLLSEKLAEIADTIAHKRNGDGAGALAVVRSDRGNAAMERIRQLIEVMLATE